MSGKTTSSPHPQMITVKVAKLPHPDQLQERREAKKRGPRRESIPMATGAAVQRSGSNGPQQVAPATPAEVFGDFISFYHGQ